MCVVTEPQEKNVVIRFVVAEGDRHSLKKKRSDKLPMRKVNNVNSNFFIVKSGKKSYTIFPQSGNVIGTGISNSGEISPTVKKFSSLFNISEAEIGEPRIINSTYSGHILCADSQFSACGKLFSYQQKDSPNSQVSISFRSQFFPGARIRVRERGTVNLFNNGKYIFVGVKKEEDAKHLHKTLCAIMAEFSTTSKPETQCAWNVVSS